MKKYFTLITLAWLLLFQDISAHPSWGIVVDKHRNIYFADINHHERGSVWMFTQEGELKLLLRNFHAHNVSLDNNGNLITAHGEDHHTMVRIKPNGEMDTLIHSLDFNEFFGGNSTFSPKNEIVFGINHYLWKINDEGKKEKISDYEFGWNQTVYADENGNYYGPDIGDKNGRLIKIDSSGNAKIIARDLFAKLDREIDPHQDVLLGITKGCDGKIYIAETAGQRIIKILDDENWEVFYKSEGKWFPTAIDFFSGDAYVLEYKDENGLEGPRITKIDEAGNQSVLFDYDNYHKGESPAAIIKNKKEGNLTIWLLIGAGTLGFLLVVNYYRSKLQKQINK